MVGESNRSVFFIQIDASSLTVFEIFEFEMSRVNCILYITLYVTFTVCDGPAAPTDGSVWVSPDGMTVKFNCDVGYTVSGTVDNTCTTNGTGWLHSSPTCGQSLPILCFFSFIAVDDNYNNFSDLLKMH